MVWDLLRFFLGIAILANLLAAVRFKFPPYPAGLARVKGPGEITFDLPSIAPHVNRVGLGVFDAWNVAAVGLNMAMQPRQRPPTARTARSNPVQTPDAADSRAVPAAPSRPNAGPIGLTTA